MKKIVSLVIVVILFATLTIIGTNWMKFTPPVSANPQLSVNQIKTTDLDVLALKIVEMKKDGDFVRVILKNISDKEINGLTLLFKDNSTITVDYTISENGIPSGELKELRIPAEMQSGSATNSIIALPFFRIVAVVFTDRTEEGDPQYISAIKDRRRGLKSQLEKLLPDLKKIYNEPETILLSTLQETNRKISELPERDLSESPSFEQGLNDGKEDLIKIIKDAMNQQSQKQVDFGRFKKSLKEKIDEIKYRINRF